MFNVNGTLAQKCCCADFRSVLDPLTHWFAKGVLKQEFYGIQVATFVGSVNFGHIKGMTVISFWRYSKFYIDFENAIKFAENSDSFEDNCVWT